MSGRHLDIAGLVDTDNGLLSPEIYFDRDVYELELEQIFGRSWLFLAYDSMIKKPGDFIQTYMGEDPILVVRQRDGSIKAFLNQCRHRGMRICRADEGNIKAFTCTYHGWTYDLAGRLINVPHEEDGYHNELDKDAWGPIQVAQLQSYKGFWFGTWDPTAPALLDYLGDMAWYFDAHIDRHEGGVEAFTGVYRWVLDCNWKFAAEQFASDAYHAEISHASASIVLAAARGRTIEQTIESRFKGGAQFSSPKGHGTGLSKGRQPAGNETVRAWVEDTHDATLARIGEARAEWVRGHSTIFPNFSYLANGTMRVWHPRGPNQIETWAWSFVPSAAPFDVKMAMKRDCLRTFSSSGLLEQDDGENWNEIQKVLRGHVARKYPLNAQMGLGHEMRNFEELPGTVIPQRIGEHPARGMYRRWSEMLQGLSWSELEARERARLSEEAARLGEFADHLP